MEFPMAVSTLSMVLSAAISGAITGAVSRGCVVSILGLSAVTAVVAADSDDTSITIYSSASPGAILPELYRPLPGSGVPNGMAVPGYALIRHDRPVELQTGRSTVKFVDVAGLI